VQNSTKSSACRCAQSRASFAGPKLSHAEALQTSMLAMINHSERPDWADPKYWAPFVVVGEPAKP
jgi:CHAT domain-containing protein